VARKELVRIERRIARLDADEAKLHADLAADATDHLRVTELDGRLRALVTERSELEDRWLELSEAAG
jgi:ATP-binding cassette subfamily F protein uup